MKINLQRLIQFVEQLRVNKSAIVLGHQNGQLITASFEDTVSVNAGTRVGKTSTFVIPSVSIHPGPVVVTSTKKDIRDATYKSRKAIADTYGGGVYELVFDSSRDSVQPLPLLYWDPISSSNSWERASGIAKSFVMSSIDNKNNSHWANKAASFLTAMLYIANYKGLTLAELKRVYSDDQCASFIADAKQLAEWTQWQESQSESSVKSDGFVGCEDAYQQLKSFLGHATIAEQERASVHSFLQEALEGITKQTKIDFEAFDFEEFVHSHGTLYILCDDDKSKLLSPFISSFLEELTRVWKKEVTPNVRHLQDLDKTLLLALDETLNIAPLPNLPRMVRSYGSKGVQVMTVLQDIGGAERIWDKEAETIYGGTNHQIFGGRFGGGNYLDYVSKVMGDETIQLVTYEISPDFNETSASTHMKELLLWERRLIEESQLTGNLDEILNYIYDHRESKGYMIRVRRDLSGSWHHRLHEEIVDATTVIKTPTRQPKVSAAILANPGEGRACVVSGSKVLHVETEPYFSSPYWEGLIEMTTEAELLQMHNALHSQQGLSL